jgi:hypothetical protein
VLSLLVEAVLREPSATPKAAPALTLATTVPPLLMPVTETS